MTYNIVDLRITELKEANLLAEIRRAKEQAENAAQDAHRARLREKRMYDLAHELRQTLFTLRATA